MRNNKKAKTRGKAEGDRSRKRNYNGRKNFAVAEHSRQPLGDDYVIGRNPVLELLDSKIQIEKMWCVRNGEGSLKKILAKAKEKRVPIVFVERDVLNRMAAGGNHQGVIAQATPYTYSTVEKIFAKANASGEDPFIIVLDGIEDGHNLGAILRTAECVGAHGVIIPERRAAGITATVGKSAAGALFHVSCARVTNLSRAIGELKEKGLWIAACTMGENMYYDADLKGPIAIVLGNEGEGISRLVKEQCDFEVSIPLMGKVNSLNASNAAAIIAYEVRRQRNCAKG